MVTRKPQVGDLADHKSRSLDPRPVAAVHEGGALIKIKIGDLISDWLPAENYTYKAPRIVAQTFKAGQRPRIRVTDGSGTNTLPNLALTKINSKTAYFRSSHVVGEMAIDVDKVEIIRHADGTPVLDSERWPALTPYDTGERLEPSVWVLPDRRRPEEFDHDRYGKVDLNNSEDNTTCTIWGEGTDEGTDVLHVIMHGDALSKIVIHTQGEELPEIEYHD